MRKATLEGDCVRRVRSSDARALRAAADVLLDGGVVAFPTETVYGLAVRCGDRAARTRLRRLKCREPAKPFQLLLASRRAALRLCPRMSALARALAHAFWPGPLTLVVRGPNGRWVGLRVPDHAVPRSLARRVGGALVATSANRTGARPARTAVEVEKALGDRVDLVLDGKKHHLEAGQKQLVERGLFHSFSTGTGMIFEEVSTTHIKGDSEYEDSSIPSDPTTRKTKIVLPS